MAVIKTQLEASGVSAYRQQMTQASSAVKAMGAELKVCEASFEQTGNQMKYLGEKSIILKQQLEEQRKAVAAAEKALETVKKQYGENSRQVMEWRQKLAQARASVIQTETAIRNTDAALDALSKDDVSGVAQDLGDVGEEAKKADTATDDLAESVGGIAGKLDRESIIKGLDAIANAMQSVLTHAWNLGKALWQVSVDAATWGDETRDAANAAVLTTTRYQQAGYAAQFFGTSIEGLTAAQPKLVQAIKGAENGVLQIGDTLVNTMEWASDGKGGFIRQERSWLDVMLDSLDALGDVESEFEREGIAMQLFGKSYRDYMGIMSSGTDAFRRKMGDAPVVGEDSVNNLADAADEVKDMNAALETLKLDVLAALAPDIELIAKAVGDLARQFDAFLKTEQGQKLLTDLSTAIQGIVDNLTKNVDFNSVVQTATSVIEGINEALGWLAENQFDVVGAIEAIAGAIVLLRTASVGLTLANSIFSLKGLLGGKGGTPTGSPTGTPTVTPTGGADMPFGTLGTGIMSAAVVAMGAINVSNANDTISKLDGEADAIRNVAEATGQAVGAYDDLIKIGTGALESKIIGQGIFGPIWGENHTAEREALKAFQAAGLEGVLSPDTYAELMATDASGASNRSLVKKITEELAAAAPEIEQAGEDTVSGYAQGMETAMPEVTAAAESMAGRPLNIITEVLDMHSPSRVMADLGAMAGLGFANGLAGMSGAVSAAASALAAAATGTINGALASIGGGVMRGIGGGARNYSANSNLYIGTYNQQTTGDVSTLANAMAHAQQQMRKAFGGRV